VSAGADVLVLGGGPVGLAIAWRLAADGAAVTVLDAGEEGAAWRVSAGMLAVPMAAHAPGDEELALQMEARERYDDFAAGLEAASGQPLGYRRDGGLAIALDEAQEAELRRVHAAQTALGRELRWLDAGEARAQEPLLSAGVRAAIASAGDGQIDPRLLVPALRRALEAAGGRLIAARATAVRRRDGRIAVETGHGSLEAATAVLAAGAWSGRIDGLPPELRRASLRPLKGQILRLRGDTAPRRILHAPDLYIFTRPGGEIVAGATVEEAGYDTGVTAAGVRRLLGALLAAVPAAAEWRLVETSAGLRPAAADERPLVGRTSVEGLLVAAGHRATGILLAPLSADAVADILAGREPPAVLEPFAAERFAATT
jgi:glycine oxidase